MIDTGRVFEIWSIGDGLFMRRVLDSVAAMSNAGLLIQLVGFGLMLGLLIMGFRNVMEGGNKLDLGTMMVAFILGSVMFGMKADVVIHDMNFAPGEIDQPDYRVDNVPFGIAAAGYIISGVGYALTEKMEQGYGLYTGGRSTLIEGGFGNTLEWINAIRMWEVPTFDDAGRNVSAFRENVGTYMSECTKPAIEMGHLNYATIARSTNLFTYGTLTSGGFGYESEYLMTQYTAPGSTTPQVLSCKDAFQQIANDSLNIMPQFAEAIVESKPNISASGTDANSAMSDAYTTIGVNNAQMQQMVVAELAGLSLQNAVANSTSTTALSTQTKMMIQQASMQRATQWAAEETLFRRVMRPMMAFFESLVYALAPLMALMIGMGSFGIKTVIQCFKLSISVILWLPMLSIIQMYQVTMMQHGVAAILSGADGVSGGAGMSISGADQLRQAAIDWLSTGAAMAAATPVLTASLVWGGSALAASLASKMQGGDHINEKMTAPDAVSTPAAVNTSGMKEYTAASGMSTAGAQGTIPTISTASSMEVMQQSYRGQMESSGVQAANLVSEAYSNSYGHDTSVGVDQSRGHSGFQATTDGSRFQVGAGTSADDTKKVDNANSSQASETTSDSTGVKLSGGTGDAMPFAQAGGGYSGEQRSSQQVLSAVQDIKSHSGGHRVDTSYSSGWEGSRGERLEQAVRTAASSGDKVAQQLLNSSQWQKQMNAAHQASEGYTESASLTSRFGMQQSVPINTLATSALAGDGKQAAGFSAAVTAANLRGEADAWEARLQPSITDKNTRRTAAEIAALYDGATNGTKGGVSESDANFRRQAFADAMNGHFNSAEMLGGTFRPDSNRNIAGDVPSYQSVTDGAAHVRGPEGDPDALRSRVEAGVHGSGAEVGRLGGESGRIVDGDPSGTASIAPGNAPEAAGIAMSKYDAASPIVDAYGAGKRADSTTGMGSGADNELASGSRVDGEERLALQGLANEVSPFAKWIPNPGAQAANAMGLGPPEMPKSIPGGGDVAAVSSGLQREFPFMGKSWADATATSQVLESKGPQFVGADQFQSALAYSQTTEGNVLMNRYSDSVSGRAHLVEDQNNHDAGRTTFKDKVEEAVRAEMQPRENRHN